MRFHLLRNFCLNSNNIYIFFFSYFPMQSVNSFSLMFTTYPSAFTYINFNLTLPIFDIPIFSVLKMWMSCSLASLCPPVFGPLLYFFLVSSLQSFLMKTLLNVSWEGSFSVCFGTINLKSTFIGVFLLFSPYFPILVFSVSQMLSLAILLPCFFLLLTFPP